MAMINSISLNRDPCDPWMWEFGVTHYFGDGDGCTSSRPIATRRTILQHESPRTLSSSPICRVGKNRDSFVKMEHDEVCKEISGELEDMARWLSGGQLGPEQFRQSVARLEDRKLRRFGLKLSSVVGEDGIVHFTLRFADTGELCASMDVDPMTGKLATQLGCP